MSARTAAPSLLPPLLALLCAAAPAARAESPSLSSLQKAQLESLRAQVADQVQLQAFDLLDELVYGWGAQPVFATDTPVVLADVSVPVGFGTGLQALVETHFASLVVKNPGGHVQLAHCPQCTALVVHSGARGTVVARGVDQPDALAKAGGLTGAKHALFLDFEAEGDALVLRARITALTPALPIVWARTLSTTTSSAALLRSGERLKSAEEARGEYLDALNGRGPLLLPLRLGVRSYAPSPRAPVISVPFLWLHLGAELPLTQARAWTAGLSGGVSWMPNMHTGFQAQARLSRLLTGHTTSLTHPDVYAFLGGSVTTIHGASALLFRGALPTAEDLVAAATRLIEPSTTFASFQLGAELRVRNRIGLTAYVESAPALQGAEAVGQYLWLGPVPIHAFGAEVSFCF
jgi:hypothetical protein